MNTRIKELEEQCTHQIYGGWTRQLNTEEFAKMIILECAKVIEGNEIDYPLTGAVYRGDQATAIKKHFGIKE
jgi:hypothetical protein